MKTFAIAELNIAYSHKRASVEDFRLEVFCLAFVFHCLASLKSFTLVKIHIHLFAFDQQVHREIKLITITLMASSKTRAPELKAENDR